MDFNLDQTVERLTEQIYDIVEKALGSANRLPMDVDASDRPGVYSLFLDGMLVYQGKSSKSLRKRLRVHRNKLKKSSKIDINKMTYSAVDFSTPIGSAIEEHLIEKHNPPWNRSGFGSNATGGPRQGQKTASWDSEYGYSRAKY